MRTVALISCVSKKCHKKSKTKDLYISTLFKKNMAYAKKIEVDEIYVLSAKYGLLKLDDKIEPYDLTLNKMKSYQKREWSSAVLEQLTKLEDLESTNFIFLAGENYIKYLIEKLPYYEIPMRGMQIGKQLQFLTEQLK